MKKFWRQKWKKFLFLFGVIFAKGSTTEKLMKDFFSKYLFEKAEIDVPCQFVSKLFLCAKKTSAIFIYFSSFFMPSLVATDKYWTASFLGVITIKKQFNHSFTFDIGWILSVVNCEEFFISQIDLYPNCISFECIFFKSRRIWNFSPSILR